LTTAALVATSPMAMADPADCPPPDPMGNSAPCGQDPEPAPPPPPPAPPVRVAMCQDGAISFTQHNNFQGTCAKHGGAAEWLAGNN
jgi:hypothetical protein